MKSFIPLFLISFMLTSCSVNTSDSSEIDYVKVTIYGKSLKPNAFNKGAGIDYYAYYEPRTDSLFYLYPELKVINNHSINVHHAFKGKLDHVKFRDTLRFLVNALNWRPAGDIARNTSEGSAYCGWHYSVEFKMGDNIKSYSVTAAINDTLDHFFDFFERLEHTNWSKKPVNPAILDIDKEVVAQLKLNGTYDQIEVPYLFPACDSGIDFTKLTGRWRQVGEDYWSTDKHNFQSYTFNPDKTFVMQSHRNGTTKHFVKGTYSVDAKAKKIVFRNKKGAKLYLTIYQLTDSCMSFTRNSANTEYSMHSMHRF